MMPVGPLMIEHRLIERVVRIAAREADRLAAGGEPDADLLDRVCDFLRTYADHCHHGKEEGILFRDLTARDLSPEHRRIMDELASEHVQARAVVGGLSDAAAALRRAPVPVADQALGHLRSLVGLYPAHIAKEDKAFFIPVMAYLTKPEQDAMLEQCYEFDRQFVHRAYGDIVEALEAEDRVPH